jgi:hypothetical protein
MTLYEQRRSRLDGASGEEQERIMKTMIWTIGGICAAVAGAIVLSRRGQQPVVEMAHKLEEAWADHHTVV